MPGTHVLARVLGGFVRASTGAPALVAGRRLGGLSASQTAGLSGRGNVAGTTAVKGVAANIPTGCRVRLYRDRDGRYMAQKYSDPVTGAYQFSNLSENYTYSVIAIDDANSYRAVIADRVPTTRP